MLGGLYMELLIKNKWVSFKGSSTVKDINDSDLFYVEGEVFSFSRKKHVLNLEHKELYMIRNKVFYLFEKKALIYDEKEELKAVVKRKFFSLHDHYKIESSLGDLEIKGNIFEFNYSITLNGKEVGHIARKISIRDSFVLTIDDSLNPAFFVALVIAIDLITDRKQQES